MSIYSLKISNSRSKTKSNILASEHHDYISREGKYSPNFSLEKDMLDEIGINNNIKAGSHYEYVERENNFSNKSEYEDLVYSANVNMPSWAKDNPHTFWKSSEIYERTNGRTYTEFLIALPHELSNEENIKLVNEFCADTFGKSFVYSYGIHSKPSSEEGIQNIHAHIMFSERKLDGIEREPEKFFSRYNPKFPERGGAKKDRYWNDRRMFSIVRNSWENILNKTLNEHNLENISCKSLEFQRLVAKENGDIYKEELFDRPAVNCDGSIIMKLNKYGIDSLTEKEKLKYEAYTLAKEIKKIKESIYLDKLEEQKFEQLSSVDYLKHVINDRANYTYNVTKKHNNEINKYNHFEEKEEIYKNALLGIYLILDNEDNLDIRNKMTTEFINIFENDREKQIITSEDNNKNYIAKVNDTMLHANYFLEVKDLEDVLEYQKELELNIKELKDSKNELVKNYSDELSNFEMQYYIEILKTIEKNNELQNLLDKYEEARKKAEEKNTSFFQKLVGDSTEKRLEKKLKIESDIKKYLENNFSKKDLLNMRINIITEIKNKNPEIYINLENNFRNFRNNLNEVEKNISIKETALSIINIEADKLIEVKEEERKERIMHPERFIDELSELEKFTLIPDYSFGTKSLSHVYSEELKSVTINKSEKISEIPFEDRLKEKINNYIILATEIKNKENKLEEYYKTCQNTDRIRSIAKSRETSSINVLNSYYDSIGKIERELIDLKDDLVGAEDILKKLSRKDSNSIGNIIIKDFKADNDNTIKRLFAKLDIYKETGLNTANIFSEIKENNNKQEIINELLKNYQVKFDKKERNIEEPKENNIDFKEKIKEKKNSSPGTTTLENNTFNEVAKMKTTPIESKKKTADVYINVPPINKKKKKGLLDDLDLDFEI